MSSDTQKDQSTEWPGLAEFKQRFRQFVAELPEEALERAAHDQIYPAALSDRLCIGIGPAVAEKMKLNAEKYPADLARGKALKYSKLK